MMEPFGVVSGAVGIASAFTACIQCFQYVQLGRNFGRDFQPNLLLLDSIGLRLSRWGEAVDIYADPSLGNPNATPEELQNAKGTLFQILSLFEDTKAISQKHQVSAKSGEALFEPPASCLDPAGAALSNTMRALAARRQKGASIIKKAQWALHHGSEFKRLIESVTLLLGNLEAMFPPPPDRQATLIRGEVQEVRDKQQLELLLGAAIGVDEGLRKAATEALAGHQYRDVEVKGKALNGDAFGRDWQRGAIGKSNMYERIVVEHGGKALNGNQYAGKDFWDD